VSGTGDRPAHADAFVPRLRRALLRWYGRNRRDLPWRNTCDPYAIWVSEIMLQQTQVATVIPYYERFLERFPDVGGLAAADEEQVLALWSGLGYYRRARALRLGARHVLEHHAGDLPADAESLRRIPGIGRYTAGAIASTAFGIREPVLDGNVRRVLSRLHAIDESVRGAAATERELWTIAGTLVDGPDPGGLNQALMELGALVCRPRDPDCPCCPLSALCAARGSGDPTRYPTPRRRAPVRRVRVAVAVLERGSSLLLERPGDTSPFRGNWDLPALVLHATTDGMEALRRELSRTHTLDVSVNRPEASARHGIMQSRLELEIHRARLRRGRVAGRDSLRWVSRDDIESTAVSGATRKVLRAIDAPTAGTPLRARR